MNKILHVLEDKIGPEVGDGIGLVYPNVDEDGETNATLHQLQHI